MKKKTKIILGILAFAAVLIILAFFFHGIPLTSFPYGTSTSVHLDSSNQYSNTYTITTVNENPTTGGCNVPPDQSLSDLIGWYQIDTIGVTNGPYYTCQSGAVQVSEFGNDWMTQCDNFIGLSPVQSNITSGSVNVYGAGSSPIIHGTCQPSTWSGSSLSCSLTTQYVVAGCYITSYSYTVTMPKTGFCLYDSQCSPGQICDLTTNTCQVTSPTPPTPPGPPTFGDFLSAIFNWIKSLFGLTAQTISGPATLQPGTTQTYNISISAPTITSDYTTGFDTVEYGNWALIDSSSQAILSQGSWQTVNGTYNINPLITIPSVSNHNYALVGIVTQANGTYDYTTGTWSWTNQTIIDQEAINIKTLYTVTTPISPPPISITSIFSSIWNFLKGIFGF